MSHLGLCSLGFEEGGLALRWFDESGHWICQFCCYERPLVRRQDLLGVGGSAVRVHGGFACNLEM
jgi:hypothetical protein